MYTGADTGLSVGCISADKVRGEGEAFSTGLSDQRSAGERAGYQGKNNTHTIQSSRHQRASKREVEIDSEVFGRGVKDGQESCFSFCIYCVRACLLRRERERALL